MVLSSEGLRIRAGFGDKRAALDAPVQRMRCDWEAAVAGMALPKGIHVRETRPGRSEWLTPEDGSLGTLVWLHGGGFNSGSPRTHRAFGAWLAEATRRRVLLVDYRLAPEWPCPAAIDDVVQACSELGTNWAIGGDSAGGGLLIAALIALRDQQQPLPEAAVAVSPWVDMTLSGESYRTRDAQDPLASREALAKAAEWYLNGLDPRDPRASPLFGDLRGLPRLLIQVGDDEVLLDDSVMLEQAAREQGVDVTLSIAEGMWHVYPLWGADLPEAADAVTQLARFVEKP